MGPRFVGTLLLTAGLTAFAGCVSPGEIEVHRLTRYQQAMAKRASAAARVDTPGLIRPPEAFTISGLQTEPVIERVTKTSCTYYPSSDSNAPKTQDRLQSVAVMTDFDLDRQTGSADANSGRVSRRIEIETIRSFERQADPGATVATVGRTLVRTVTRRVELAPGPEAGKLVRRAETTTTRTYQRLPRAVEKAGEADAEGAEDQVLVKTNVKTTRYLRAKPEAVTDPEVNTTTTIPVWQFEAISGPPWHSRAKTQQATERARIGRDHADPAVLETSRRLVRLTLAEAIRAALATNPEIRVVSFDPAVSAEEMVKAAAAFDTAVFFNMNFRKEEGGNPALGLVDDARRVKQWSAGLRRRTVTGASWTLRSELSRNWDSSSMDGLYKSVAALDVTQPLLRGAWPEYNLAALRIARINRRLSDAQFRATVEETITAVTAAYWQLVRARRIVRIQQELIAAAHRALSRVRARLNVDATRASVEQGRATLRERQADLIDTRRTVADMQDRLVHLAPARALKPLGDAEIVPTSPPIRAKVKLDPAEQLLTAVRHSPLLEQARLAVAGAKVNITVAENQTLPMLDLTASVQMQRYNPSLSGHSQVFSSDEYAVGYEFDLLLDYPIGNRAAIAQLRQAKLAHTQSIVSMQKTVNDLALAINEQVRGIDRTYEKVQAYQGVMRAADAELQAVRQGESAEPRLTPQILRTRLRAQEDLARAKRRFEQALSDYNIARAELNRTIGTVLELNRVRIAWPALLQAGGHRPSAAASR